MADMSPLNEWLEKTFKKPDESTSRAIARLQTETGLGSTTIYYALRGARTLPAVARQLEAFTNGAVRAADLVLAPSRKEVVEGDADRAARRASPCATTAPGHADPLEPVRTEA